MKEQILEIIEKHETYTKDVFIYKGINENHYDKFIADLVKLFAIPDVSNSVICEHKNEVTRQGDGFTYVVCGDCGADL